MSFYFGVFAPTTSRAYIKQVPIDPASGSSNQSFLAAAGNFALGIPDAGKFEFDVVRTETHKNENIIPQYPIEDGSKINDHVTRQPTELSLTVLISDTPISAISPTVSLLQSGRGRYREEYAKLEEMFGQANGSLFTVVTGLQVYKDMLFKELTPSRDATGHFVTCELKFVQGFFSGVEDNTAKTDTSVEHSVGGSSWVGLVSLVPLAVV